MQEHWLNDQVMDTCEDLHMRAKDPTLGQSEKRALAKEITKFLDDVRLMEKDFLQESKRVVTLKYGDNFGERYRRIQDLMPLIIPLLD